MSSRKLDWSPRAHMRRTLRVDAKITVVDVVYGAGYVAMGLFLFRSTSSNQAELVSVPFVFLALVMGYLAVRICGPEGNSRTATFYANLPRPRASTFRTHATWLGLCALVLELIIIVLLFLRNKASQPDQFIATAPFSFILPYFAIALTMWLIYAGYRWYVQLPVCVLVLYALVAILNKHKISTIAGHSASQYFIVLAAFIIVTALIIVHTHHRWQRRQLGEIA